MIYCIWYPSGGFGHFVNAIISLYGKNFVKKDNSRLNFGATGDSHQYALATPKYLHDPDDYDFEFDQNKNYTVLIDNGINNQTDKFKSFFPGSKIIKICYLDRTWPIVAKTMIEKAMESDFNSEVKLNQEHWPVQDQWAYREKYFLFLRDHSLRSAWRPAQDNDITLYIDDLLDYYQFHSKLQTLLEIKSFEEEWRAWRVANKQYIDPITLANNIMKSIKNQQSLALDDITNVWTQAVVYYYIWLTYNFEVPHNDYSDWFTNTNDIVRMLDKHKIII
jgi:hypothetical protein